MVLMLSSLGFEWWSIKDAGLGRGVGETNACGTGACAAVVAGFHLQKKKANASVLLRGGQLLIDYDVKAQKVSKQGPAKFVFSSEITI